MDNATDKGIETGTATDWPSDAEWARYGPAGDVRLTAVIVRYRAS